MKESQQQEVFNKWIADHRGLLFKVIRSYADTEVDQNDLFQEIALQVYKSVPNFKGASSVVTWLYRIAANAAKNHLVALGRRPTSDMALDDSEVFDVPGRLKDHESPDEVIMGQQLEALISRTIEELPVELRAALTLREFEGLSYEEIADVLECPIGTVRSRIFRAREAIDVKVAQQLQGSEH